MGFSATLAPDLDRRTNRRLRRSLMAYLELHPGVGASALAGQWMEDKLFWASGTWIEGLLARPDCKAILSRALALLIQGEERRAVRRQRSVLRTGRTVRHPGRPRASMPWQARMAR